MHATLGSTDPTAKALPRRHAVVVGGSMAGMLAARVLADHFERVTVLERDHLPDTPSHRKGLPQARHVHVLLERGRMALERLLPGLTTDLLAAGARLLDNSGDLATLTPFGWGLRFRSGLQLLACSRAGVAGPEFFETRAAAALVLPRQVRSASYLEPHAGR
jgi:hypothetical protein